LGCFLPSDFPHFPLLPESTAAKNFCRDTNKNRFYIPKGLKTKDLMGRG
jgi:hypothetical protein